MSQGSDSISQQERLVRVGREMKTVFGSEDSEELKQVADIHATRHLADTLDRMGKFIGKQTEKLDDVVSVVADLKTDIAVMKKTDEQFHELRERVIAIEALVLALQLRNAEQDGAAKLAEMVRKFWPAVLGLGALIYSFFVGKHG